MAPRISSDVMEHAILPYCDFSTLIQLKQVSRSMRNMIERHRVNYKPVMRRVETLLARMFPDFQTRLRPALIASGAVISGGFLVHALLPEVPFDDVDVYVTQNEWAIPRPLFEYAMSIKDTFSEAKINDMIRNFGFNPSYTGHQRDEIGIKTVQNFWRNNNRLQVITLEKKLDPWENIQRTFDLDVCINKYCGRSVSVEFAHSVANKQMMPGVSAAIKDLTGETFQRRVAKYRAKGFQFVDPMGLIPQQQRRKIIAKARELKARMETEEAELRKFMRENQIHDMEVEELGDSPNSGLTAPPPKKHE